MTIIQSWWKSLYSPKDIAIKRFDKIGKTILYVFLLSLFSIIPASIYSSQDVVEVANEFDEIVKTSIPEFEIVDGKLNTDISTPTTVVHNNTYILIDSTGEWDASELNQYDQSIGLLQKEFAYNIGGTIQTLPYTTLNGMISSKDDFVNFVDKMISILPLLIALIIIASYIFSAGIKFIEISIIALFGLTFTRLLNKNLPYRKLWLLSAYAITLSVTFLTLMHLLNITVVYSYFVYWFVSLTMLYLSLREIPAKQ
ncbi:DUF1189 domain-containing protein [Bacillus suaedaesalsae]|uniref:DUF1189 domain-containing protein n=1 Tax=Bacillus suaedaesalsae TaxID=2810349 RepID=A0ABS2DFK8_9BACI|nr:DUF1189 domain-containing protein [Bacillus suaedaesalsae]MBM6617234.1 DUF1189 domain-containing protein [Bacillus suaedaesalsae]